MVFTDPPYNVPIRGHVGGSGAIRHPEFAMAYGEMTSPQFTAFLRSAFQSLVAHSINGSIHFICMDWRHMRESRFKEAPRFSPRRRLDETRAARQPVLKWRSSASWDAEEAAE